MRKQLNNLLLFLLAVPLTSLVSGCRNAQGGPGESKKSYDIYSPVQLNSLMVKPLRLEGYVTHQRGPLSRIEPDGSLVTDTTFTVEKIRIPGDDILITGWLYLPKQEGKFPVVVLTNGGGDETQPIKSLSEFMAPILAHCGIAAFVHDKRGTGESGGDYIQTSYEDYIRDAGNCARWLAGHDRIDPGMVGAMGGSEGGRVAVSAACRYPEIKFVISQAGSVVSNVDDRLYAQLNGMADAGILDETTMAEVKPLWERSFRAWETMRVSDHEKVNREISEWRKKYNRRMLPFTNLEMESIPEFSGILPTWRSIQYDYLTELGSFTKNWLAIFGEADRVVPTEASVKNIIHYMSESGSNSYNIAVIPECGHAPVNIRTGEIIRIDYLVVNWIWDNIVNSAR